MDFSVIFLVEWAFDLKKELLYTSYCQAIFILPRKAERKKVKDFFSSGFVSSLHLQTGNAQKAAQK